MNLVKTLCTCVLFIATLTAKTQSLYKGKILDQNSKTPLPYVNIGILGKGIGTVTDENGNFEIKLNTKNHNDTLQISMVGYESKIYRVSDFIKKRKKESNIHLSEKTEYLVQAYVSGKAMKEKTLGNKTRSRMNIVEFQPEELGYELGTKIKIKKGPTYLKRFNASMASHTNDGLKFRLNIYGLKNGKPDKSLLRKNIIVTSEQIKNRILSVDLSEYNIVVKHDFFVSLECIENPKKHELQFCARIIGSPILFRETSQDVWKKIEIGSVAFNVVVKY